MNQVDNFELATRVIEHFRQGRITEHELVSRLSELIFEPHWTEIDRSLNRDESQFFRDNLRILSFPETMVLGGDTPSREEKGRIRKWLEEVEGLQADCKQGVGMGMRYANYLREGRVGRSDLFYVLSKFVMDEDWSVISKLLGPENVKAFREYLQYQWAPTVREAREEAYLAELDVDIPSPEDRERLRSWQREHFAEDCT